MNTFSTTTLKQALEQTQTKRFHQHLRCDSQTFLSIVALIEQHQSTPIHHNTKHEIMKRVALNILYLAKGSTSNQAAAALGVPKTRAVVYVNQLLIILTKLSSNYITMPSVAHEVIEVCDGFEAIAGFPQVIGAIDGTLTRINRPVDYEGWYCCKNFPAINMQAAVNNRRLFCSFSIRVGSTNDQSLWNSSGLRLFKRIPSGTHLLGNAGYKSYRHLLTPYNESSAIESAKKRRYNHLHSKTRIKVECTFGILKNQYRILMGKLQQKILKQVVQVVVGCLVLHNLIIIVEDSVQISGSDPARAQPPATSCLSDEDEVSHHQDITKRNDIAKH